MNCEVLIINVDELWLKGKNRPLYFRALRAHVKDVLKAYHFAPFKCVDENERLIAESDTPFSIEVIQALTKVPGLHSILPCVRVPLSLEEATKAAVDGISQLVSKPRTFKVVTKRINKQFQMSSMDFSKHLGHELLVALPDLRVDIHKPDLVVEVKILAKAIYVSVIKVYGMMGLPWNTSGHLLSLISGGFDSPVASYLMMRRGCKESFVFFYAYPFIGEEVKEKIIKMVAKLAEYQPKTVLHIVPFGNIQKAISARCKEEYRTLLFRKYMMDSSAHLAKEIYADALLTGDSLGQVSSQTLYNISLLDQYSELSILRPLTGMTKQEIMDRALIVGTHDISIIPHDDACALFAPQKPIINPDKKYFEEVTKELDLEIDNLIKEAILNKESYFFDLRGSYVKKNKNSEF